MVNNISSISVHSNTGGEFACIYTLGMLSTCVPSAEQGVFLHRRLGLGVVEV